MQRAAERVEHVGLNREQADELIIAARQSSCKYNYEKYWDRES